MRLLWISSVEITTQYIAKVTKIDIKISMKMQCWMANFIPV